jgi:hypothetical protein
MDNYILSDSTSCVCVCVCIYIQVYIFALMLHERVINSIKGSKFNMRIQKFAFTCFGTEHLA